jgi:hypothetical protein
MDTPTLSSECGVPPLELRHNLELTSLMDSGSYVKLNLELVENPSSICVKNRLEMPA